MEHTRIEAVSKPRRWLRPLLMGLVPAVLLAIGAYIYLTSGRYVSTDNAYVQRDKVSISADVSGRITEVDVRENQQVRRGDVLFRLDDTPFRIALAQADAAVGNAQLQVAQLRSSYQGTSVDIQGARNDIAFAQEDYARQAALLKQGFTTRARFEQALHELQAARKTLATAQADAAKARAALSDLSGPIDAHPLVRAALAQRAKAALDLARSTVRAPLDGIVSQTDRLQPGQVIAAGLPVVSLVVSNHSWVEANFKETDLTHMRVGQPATIELDAYPDQRLHARVASIGAGTGSEFSVLPAQNATGNWVKVVQRVPVRLEFTDRSDVRLLAGLSADVRVDTKGRVVSSTLIAQR